MLKEKQLETMKRTVQSLQQGSQVPSAKAQSDSKQMLFPFMKTESSLSSTKKEQRLTKKNKKNSCQSNSQKRSKSNGGSSMQEWLVLGMYTIEIPVNVVVSAKDRASAKELAKSISDGYWNFGEETDWQYNNKVVVKQVLQCRQMELPLA